MNLQTAIPSYRCRHCPGFNSFPITFCHSLYNLPSTNTRTTLPLTPETFLILWHKHSYTIHLRITNKHQDFLPSFALPHGICFTSRSSNQSVSSPLLLHVAEGVCWPALCVSAALTLITWKSWARIYIWWLTGRKIRNGRSVSAASEAINTFRQLSFRLRQGSPNTNCGSVEKR